MGSNVARLSQLTRLITVVGHVTRWNDRMCDVYAGHQKYHVVFPERTISLGGWAWREGGVKGGDGYADIWLITNQPIPTHMVPPRRRASLTNCEVCTLHTGM